jgi:hypothetical protein
MHTTPGFAEHAVEHTTLASKMGFSYRTLLGELLHAYITARPDIGYAVATLAKFSAAPAKIHHQGLKGVAKHLRSAIDWGTVCWRSAPNLALDHVPLQLAEHDPLLPAFPASSSPSQLRGFVDASHANDLRNRKSTAGYGFCIASGLESSPIRSTHRQSPLLLARKPNFSPPSKLPRLQNIHVQLFMKLVSLKLALLQFSKTTSLPSMAKGKRNSALFSNV